MNAMLSIIEEELDPAEVQQIAECIKSKLKEL